MDKNYQIDSTDRQILSALAEDSRTPFVEIANALDVAPGTIHLRVEKLKQAGILRRFTTEIDPAALGYGVECLIGIKLHDGKHYKSVVQKLKKYGEILEVYYTTGTYNLFVKVVTTTNRAFYEFLSERLQSIPEIQSTESVMVLDVPFRRGVNVGAA